ncbi:hypothetical protein BESEP4_00007 [Staphylococcus phage vB_SepM_BE04]|nr:hypothetical protein BESEP4_00007 [Staphylococcus phage vB_SepM_BE04]
MKKITQEELNNKIELHKEWLEDDNKGEKLELNGYNLRNLDLSNSDLRYSSLSCSILSNVDLSYSDLSFSTLKDADLVKMDLTKAIISFSNLENIDLNSVNLKNANLYGANLDSSYLRCVDFKNASLKNANLDNAHLENCNLEDVNLSQANTRCIEGLEVYSIDNIGTFAGKVTYLPEQDKVFAGCWKGNLEEFLEKGLEMNKDNEKEKRNIFNAYQFFLSTTID